MERCGPGSNTFDVVRKSRLWSQATQLVGVVLITMLVQIVDFHRDTVLTHLEIKRTLVSPEGN